MDDDQQFCLRWNNHQSTLVAVFDTLLENEKLVDCTLAAEGKFLNAHKVVLSACSPYFESLLSRHYDKHPILILKDVKFQELKAMMDYMYRGEVNISQDQLGALLKAAESLQIKGLSDNKKDDQPTKRPAPTPAPPKSPQPQTQLPKVQGLTIEQRSRDDREGSMSPGPRKKKRMRRKSEEMDNHHDASNSSDAHSLPPQNIPSATTQLPANIKLNSDVPETIETKQEILTRHKEEIGSQQSQVPMIKEKLETHTELMLEPKSEYVEEMNEDSIEDLTLDDDDLSNMDQMDDGAGPSHGGEGSSQGFGHWQMGNQSQDEVFLAAQEAVGAHRDSQGIRSRYTDISGQCEQYDPKPDYQRRPLLDHYTSHPRETQLLAERRRCNPHNIETVPRPVKQYSITQLANKLMSQKLSQDRQQMISSQSLSSENSSNIKAHNISTKYNTESINNSTSQKHISSTDDTVISDQRINPKRNQESETSSNSKFIKPSVSQTTLKVRCSKELDDSRPSQKLVEFRSSLGSTKPANQGTGLLTDSLSCIFTRRPQKINQHKVPQKRVFFEEVPESMENLKEKEVRLSTTDSKYPCEKKIKYQSLENQSLENQCPEPPIISQATPNISNEDWFAAKQRILSSVNHEPSSKPICGVQAAPEHKCPEPPQISVDPHGFDIEPPAHLNKNVSPYVPSNSFERDEYNKYKSQQLKNEAALILAQKRYKQGFEAPLLRNKEIPERQNQPVSNFIDNNGRAKTDFGSDERDITYKSYQQREHESMRIEQQISSSEPKSSSNDYQKEHVNYEPTQQCGHDSQSRQGVNIQQYDHQQSSYNKDSYEEKMLEYKYKSSSLYYDDPNTRTYKNSRQMLQSEQSHMFETTQGTNSKDQNDLDNMCPEPPHISEDSQMIKDEVCHEEFENIPPNAPVISQESDNTENHYEDDHNFDNYRETQSFKETLVLKPTQAMDGDNQNMCHRCSFQTTNPRKLKDHLKFVHGETKPDVILNPQNTSELFSRREPKSNDQNDLFSRRDTSRNEIATGTQQLQIQGRFKRRNTSNVVNVISADIIVPARIEPEEQDDNKGDTNYADEKTKDSGVLAAMEYFETTKDQPRKPRPYRRNPDELLDDDWI